MLILNHLTLDPTEAFVASLQWCSKHRPEAASSADGQVLPWNYSRFGPSINRL